MGAISTAININDGLTSVINSMYRSMSTLIGAFESANRASSHIIDTSALNSARESMKSAVADMEVLRQSVNKAVSWNSQQKFSVFGAGGTERLAQEVNSFENLIEKVMRSQSVIKSTALNMRILPEGAERDILKIDAKVRELITSMQELKNIDKSNFSSEQIRQLNNEYENMRQTLTSLINLQSSIRNGIGDNNISAVNSGFNQFLSNVEQAQMRVRGMTESLRQMTSINWQSIVTPEIFNTTGTERARQEFAALQRVATTVIETQNQISQRAAGMTILPPNAIQEISGINARIANISSTIVNLEQEKNKLNTWNTAGIDRYNNYIESLRGKLSEAEQAQEAINKAINENNVENLNAGFTRLNSILNNTENEIRQNTINQNEFNNSLLTGIFHANNLFNQIKSIIGAYMGIYGIRRAFGFIKESLGAYNIQLNAENQLAAVLANTLDESYVSQFEIGITADTEMAVNEINGIQDSINEVTIPVSASAKALETEFNEITSKASEIQSRGIYGDEAMIAAAAEFATYFSDKNAIMAMMDTLADYAMGMTGGGEVDTSSMVNYATNLGKIMTGSYQAMNLKGFKFTETQKAIIEGEATREQIVRALGTRVE